MVRPTKDEIKLKFKKTIEAESPNIDVIDLLYDIKEELIKLNKK